MPSICLDLEFFYQPEFGILLFHFYFSPIIHHDLHHNRFTLASGTAAARRAAWLSALGETAPSPRDPHKNFSKWRKQAKLKEVQSLNKVIQMRPRMRHFRWAERVEQLVVLSQLCETLQLP